MPGVEVLKDCCAGVHNGIFYIPASINPTTYERSYARTGHFDNITRSNYDLITGHKVLKVLFEGTTAIGVQAIQRSGATGTTGEPVVLKARKEVIITAGAIHTPHLLQLSGIGPRGLLERANISVVVDLPGVGQKFQDQGYTPSMTFRCE
jgi:choline dehydrogenase-like flavoprotein